MEMAIANEGLRINVSANNRNMYAVQRHNFIRAKGITIFYRDKEKSSKNTRDSLS